MGKAVGMSPGFLNSKSSCDAFNKNNATEWQKSNKSNSQKLNRSPCEINASDYDQTMTTGELIRAARKAAGMTQVQLAERTGITFQQLSKYERGVFEPRLAQLRTLAKSLRVKPGHLIGDQ
jgi:ribosome-binding protein aMBF1 (putative translation factor)